jgi:Domain of unknown function (DUF4145)
MDIWDCFMVCGACGEASIIVFGHPAGYRPNKGSPKNCPTDPVEHGFTFLTLLPHPESPRVPGYLPTPLPNLFMQAADSLRRGSWDASGAMSRKVLDVSTKEQLKGLSAPVKDLAPRIDKLASIGRLTDDLRAWAHQIRLGGNDAAHDEDPFTKEEAEELLDFTELFLTYIYTLPGRLAAKKKPHP